MPWNKISTLGLTIDYLIIMFINSDSTQDSQHPNMLTHILLQLSGSVKTALIPLGIISWKNWQVYWPHRQYTHEHEPRDIKLKLHGTRDCTQLQSGHFSA